MAKIVLKRMLLTLFLLILLGVAITCLKARKLTLTLVVRINLIVVVVNFRDQRPPDYN